MTIPGIATRHRLSGELLLTIVRGRGDMTVSADTVVCAGWLLVCRIVHMDVDGWDLLS